MLFLELTKIWCFLEPNMSAPEEVLSWLTTRLDALGLDASVYVPYFANLFKDEAQLTDTKQAMTEILHGAGLKARPLNPFLMSPLYVCSFL
jgi:hypothetical protein